MSETLPRWNLPKIDFIDTDPEAIKASIIHSYEVAAGRVLAVADPIRIFLLSVASEIIQQRVLINQAAKNNLLSYATGNYLDALGNYLSVPRLPAGSAVCNIRFTLSQALSEVYTIPAGTEVTNGIVTFATNEDLLIPSGTLIGDVSATCTVPGTVGNGYYEDQVNTIVRPMTFVAKAANTNTTEGGSDEESDEDYAERIRLAPNSFSVAGPKNAYIFHAFSASSAVVDVSVDSPTPGVVNVYPILANGVIPDETLREQIKAYLSDEDIRPMTDDVHVLAATPVNYQINVRYFIRNEDKAKGSAIQVAVAAAVEEYKQWQHGKIGRDILPSKLVAMVINAGACRIDSGMFPVSYTQLNSTQVAQCVPTYARGQIRFNGYPSQCDYLTIANVTFTFTNDPEEASGTKIYVGNLYTQESFDEFVQRAVDTFNNNVDNVVASGEFFAGQGSYVGDMYFYFTAKEPGESGNLINLDVFSVIASKNEFSGGKDAVKVTFGGYEEG